MSGRWDQLLQPITEANPCGESLEDSDQLAAFDAFRLFGQAKPLDAPPETDEKGIPEKRIPKPPESPEWIAIRDKALEALAKSKDLRLLAYLGTAALRTDGITAFADTLKIAAEWLEAYWSQVYPLIDEDAVLRRSALNCFADPMAVVDALRRTRLVVSRQHGAFSLRDVDIATHQLTAPANPAEHVDENQVNAAFASMAIGDLVKLEEGVTGSIGSLGRIDAKMRESAGTEAGPQFDPLKAQLARMTQVLRAQMSQHPERAAVANLAAPGDAAPGEGGLAAGPVKSRQDAIRALDAVADFFKRTEPSSPIPLFLARAKRLVSKDFLEVLADVAPDAVAQARAAGGLKDQ
jgi:type VI secretion system protein ImpA